ncbi:MAG: LCP family protein, partial [Selenomonadaceae bacterium]|nr:LCP family protein [Selenomonadaceae bacterium]
PGQQHMDGKTAVTYVRYRDSEGDIGRVKRQQAFMAACLDKVTSPEIVTRIPKILREVIDAVETDMSLRQLLEVAGALKAAQQNGLETDMVPGYPLYIDDISYWIPDVELLRLTVADALGISVDPMFRERFERAAREYNDSIPDGAKDIPDGEDNIGRPVRDSRDRRRVDDRTTSTSRRTYDDERTRYNDRYTYEDDRNSVTSRRSYDNERTRSDDGQTYDNERTRSDDRQTYDSDRTRSDDRQTYDSDRTRSDDRQTYDSDRTRSDDRQTYDSDRRTYEAPQIERRDVPDTNFTEPNRDDASKTRY